MLAHRLLGLLYEHYVRVVRKSNGRTERGRIFEIRPESIVLNHAQGGVEVPLMDIEEIRVGYEWPKGHDRQLVIRLYEGKWEEVDEIESEEPL